MYERKISEMSQILILGATSDIATAVAHHFARNKFDVVVAGRSKEQLSKLAADIKIRHRVNSQAVVFDASTFDRHTELDAVIQKSDVVLCAIGYLGDQETSRTTWSESYNVITSNFTGAVSVLNRVGEIFREKKQGCIIGISSVAGERGRGSNYIYGSSKAGFTAYLSGLRNYLFPFGVHVMTVQPGFVKTKMTDGLPLPKPATAMPEKVALDIFNGYKKKKNVIYTLWMWRWIMLIIKSIPEGIFKKLKL
jgi:decaprenylphospho-beta-D-erythro-pentofuranosid-2-ulose 2-reductase